MRVELPWPDKALSPNARQHHMALHRARKAAKHGAMGECLAQRIPRMVGPVKVAMTFHPPAKRRYDQDGLLSRMKAALDGIAAHVGVDDHLFVLAAPVIADPIKGGRVIVDLTPVAVAGPVHTPEPDEWRSIGAIAERMIRGQIE